MRGKKVPVIYEDDMILVCEKPIGMPVQGDYSRDLDVETCLKTGDFAPINAWNRENIWQHGCLYKPAQLLERVLGEPFDPNVYLDYLEAKCKDVYGI